MLTTITIVGNRKHNGKGILRAIGIDPASLPTSSAYATDYMYYSCMM